MKLLLVDMSSIFYSAWHAGADKPVGFAYEVTIDRVRRAAKDVEHVVVACDAGHSGRRDLHPGYKANRPEKDPAMLDQIRRTQETLDRDGYLVAKAAGFEADDVIGHFARWAEARGDEVEILSSDKDLAQLASERVRIRSVRTNEVMGPTEVQAKFGVRPNQMRDYLALIGDTSDNIPGVPGVGAKHAARLLGQFGTIGGIIEALDAKDERDNPLVRPPGIHAAISAALRGGSLELAQKLVSLRTDVPVRCEAALERRDPKPLRPDFGTDLAGEEEDDVDEREQAEQGATVAQTEGSERAAAPPQPIRPVDALARAETTTTELVPADSRWALEPRSMKGAVWLARSLFESRLFAGTGNNGYGSPEQILTTILAGREMGLGAITSLRGLYVIKGKIAMGASLMVGLCLSSGRAEYFEPTEFDARHATYVAKRRGSAREVSMTFTIEQARQMGLLNPSRSGEPTQWEKDPENMLRHRASSRLARALFPDIVSNCYLPDELDAEDVVERRGAA